MRCRNCGKELSSDDNYCAKCGIKLDGSDAKDGSRRGPETHHPSWLIVTTILVVALIAVMLITRGSENRVAKKAKEDVTKPVAQDIKTVSTTDTSEGAPAVEGSGTTSETTSSRDRFLISANGKFGYMDKSGAIVIKPKYDDAASFSDGLAAVQVDKKYGFIDIDGKIAIRPRFDSVGVFMNGLAAVVVDGRYGYVAKSGKIAVEPDFAEAGEFSAGLAPARKGDRFGFIDSSGRFIIEPHYKYAAGFSEDLARVRTTGEKFGYIDKKDNLVIVANFSTAGDFSQGRAAVKIDSKSAYIDKNGKIIRELPYPAVFEYSEGMAVYEAANGKYGYIDIDGEVAVKAAFDKAWPFENGLARVLVDKKIGYINTAGEYVWGPSN